MTRSFMRAALVAGVLGVAGPALLAHAKLEKTEPAANATVTKAPAQVSVTFSEAPDAAVSKLSIKGPGDKVTLVKTHVMGKQLMASVQGQMPDGLYTVSWQTAGDDGHAQKGDFAFTLKTQ
jgi:methionine-rich copper-binding protein CopC